MVIHVKPGTVFLLRAGYGTRVPKGNFSMKNFDALYNSVHTTANEALRTVGLSDSLKSEIKCTIAKAAVKEEFKLFYVHSNIDYVHTFPSEDMQCRVYMEKPIALFNAITAFMHSPNYDEVKKSFKKLDKCLSKARAALVDHIESEHVSGARLKYFICPKCGANYQLYVFGNAAKDMEVNVGSVSNVIAGKGCWYCSDENGVLPF